MLSTSLVLPARAEHPMASLDASRPQAPALALGASAVMAVTSDPLEPTDERDDSSAGDGRQARVLLGTGIGIAAAGGATLLFVTLPSFALKQRALARSALALRLETRREWLEIAYRRDLTMQVSAFVGLGLTVVGASLAITGAVLRRRARADSESAPQVRLAPALGGAVLSGRF